MENKVIDGPLLGEALKAELKKGYDIVKLSRWAFSVYSNNIRALTPCTNNILQYLFSMEDDPQFEYTEDELYEISEMLINGEKDPIKKIHDRYQEKLKAENDEREQQNII
ncbi:hypothetical protein PNK_p0022 (plasmid) [Candidatus Protochlamydia naegleriophila]|uniref:Uncharacterized protein n=1 Tax=Candidatus Protochlamydia naegleriophila TaxID=389348 RepID=A0A0U5CSP9_9BACT|nr:hypothetical protein [Candidatus Protochlamydia naegleriophila]CUI18076.1 hypothetical protein PNK_p0022 [Candidatus Protochlamydia naegleriophila]